MAKLRTEPAAYDLRAAIEWLLDEITEGKLLDLDEGDAVEVRDRLRHMLAMSAPRHEKP